MALKVSKSLIIIISLITISNSFLFAVQTLPNEYKLLATQDGSYFFTGDKVSSDSAVSYLIKDTWANSPQVLYIWKGINRQSVKAKSLGGILIISSYIIPGKDLLVAFKENYRYFIGLLDSNGDINSICELFITGEQPDINSAKFYPAKIPNIYFLLINGFLFKCDLENKTAIKTEFISERVLSFASNQTDNANIKPNDSSFSFAYIQNSINSLDFTTVDYAGLKSPVITLPYSDYSNIYLYDDYAIIITSPNAVPNSLIFKIKKNENIIWSSELPTFGNLITYNQKNSKSDFYFIFNDEGTYKLGISAPNILNQKEFWHLTDLPKDYIKPLGFWESNSNFYIMFENGLAGFDNNGKTLSLDYLQFGTYFNNKPDFYYKDDYIIFSSNQNSVILEKHSNTFWFVNSFLENSGRILLPAVLILFLLILFQFYRHQKRFINTILNLPSTGSVFVFDRIGRLKDANPKAKNLINIPESVHLRRMFSYYCKTENTKQLEELITRALQIKNSFNQKISVGDTELYCNVTPIINFFGKFKGFVLTGYDITEELQRKRLSNWAQLAHDMQTNLSTIKLNAELMAIDSIDENSGRRNKIIQQTRILIQRIRDIVTVGRNNNLDKCNVNSIEFCKEVIEEFDTTMFPFIKFELDCNDFNFVCDKAKLLRALRNAVENGIKYLNSQEGIISISCRQIGGSYYFSVKDTGMGMDTAAKQNMLKPYFTSSPEKGGMGIGTMIMQHVMELHGGKIEVNSEPGIGTEILFILPKIRI